MEVSADPIKTTVNPATTTKSHPGYVRATITETPATFIEVNADPIKTTVNPATTTKSHPGHVGITITETPATSIEVNADPNHLIETTVNPATKTKSYAGLEQNMIPTGLFLFSYMLYTVG